MDEKLFQNYKDDVKLDSYFYKLVTTEGRT